MRLPVEVVLQHQCLSLLSTAAVGPLAQSTLVDEDEWSGPASSRSNFGQPGGNGESAVAARAHAGAESFLSTMGLARPSESIYSSAVPRWHTRCAVMEASEASAVTSLVLGRLPAAQISRSLPAARRLCPGRGVIPPDRHLIRNIGIRSPNAGVLLCLAA
jgi:hypothetical protein